MMRRVQKPYLPVLLFAMALLAAACAPRPEVIADAVAATLTAAVPTSALPVDRATSTPVPTQPPSLPEPTPVPPTPTPDVAATDAALAATEAAVPTDAAPATSAADPTVDAQGTPQPVAVGDEIFLYDFEDEGPWTVGDFDNESVNVVNEALLWVQKTAGRFSLRFSPKSAGDFFAATNIAVQGDCRTGDYAGMLFRVQDTANFYAAMVNCEREYRVVRVVGGASESLIDWTQASIINRGNDSENKLAIKAEGSTITVYVNDEELGTATDTRYRDGRFGLIVSAVTTTNFTVAFDDYAAYELP